MRVDKLNFDKRLNELREVNTEKIYYIQEEMQIVKTELEFLRNIQIEYYSKLLRMGDDVRGKGLIWIVETLWDLEHKIDKSHLPEIFDERSKEFILELACKDSEMLAIKNEFQQYKQYLKNILDSDIRFHFYENGQELSKFKEIIKRKNDIISGLRPGGKVEKRR